MLIHRVETGQHFAELIRANGDHQGKPDSRIVRVTATNPVPELEHVGGIYAKLFHLLRVC